MALALKRIYCNKPASQTRPYLWRRTAFKRPFIKSQARTRSYATQTSLGRDTSVSTSRKQVTVTSDDGSVRWTDLSAREKAARATQQSFNFLTILTGTVLTGAVVYFLYQEVFSSDSKTRHFNRAVDRVKSDQRCIELLGNSKEIKAYGEPTLSKWARARPIASTTSTDRYGVEHLVMHFNVEGPLNTGVVNLHVTKRPDQSDSEYKYLALDVKGHPRLYLENNASTTETGQKRGTKMFGVRWS